MKEDNFNLVKIHMRSGWNEETISKSELCGCFSCENIFPKVDIIKWINEPSFSLRGAGRTALCPYCNIDSVLPESNSYEITSSLLASMNKRWFT